MGERYHVIPSDREHIDSPECWCQPELDYKDPYSGNEVWVHREVQ